MAVTLKAMPKNSGAMTGEYALREYIKQTMGLSGFC
jgi:hypothetical protein